MAKLTLSGQVVADFPEIYLGDLAAIVDHVEKVNAILSSGQDSIVGGFRVVLLILDLVNALLVHRGAQPLTVDINKLPRSDIAPLIQFYVELLTGADGAGSQSDGTAEVAAPALNIAPAGGQEGAA